MESYISDDLLTVIIEALPPRNIGPVSEKIFMRTISKRVSELKLSVERCVLYTYKAFTHFNIVDCFVPPGYEIGPIDPADCRGLRSVNGTLENIQSLSIIPPTVHIHDRCIFTDNNAMIDGHTICMENITTLIARPIDIAINARCNARNVELYLCGKLIIPNTFFTLKTMQLKVINMNQQQIICPGLLELHLVLSAVPIENPLVDLSTLPFLSVIESEYHILKNLPRSLTSITAYSIDHCAEVIQLPNLINFMTGNLNRNTFHTPKLQHLQYYGQPGVFVNTSRLSTIHHHVYRHADVQQKYNTNSLYVVKMFSEPIDLSNCGADKHEVIDAKMHPHR